MIAIQLTDEALARYVGGQLEIQNDLERYLYRGEVAEAKVVDGNLHVAFKWLAKAKQVPGEPGDQVFPLGGWVSHSNLQYLISLGICVVSDIGDNRICINSPFLGELSVLYPPNGSKLDPRRVEGLVLS